METNLKFNSAICTSRSQSERLLALGLKAETADMYYTESPRLLFIRDKGIPLEEEDFPAWSLHRLIEMTPMLFNPIRNLFVSNKSVEYQMSEGRTTLIFANENNIYDNVINCIEWLISVDEFNKEYLEE